MAQEKNLGTSAAVSALAGSAGQVVKLLINLLSLIVLARLLSPEDYGITALAFALIGVAEMVRDMGLSTASIRAPHLSRSERDNLWWANTVLGVICTVASSIAAPFIALSYSDSRLIMIVISMSLVFTLSGMATQYRCDLIRKLQYGRLTAWEFTASATALGTAIVVALLGGGYWALITQQVLNNFLILLGLAKIAGWLPKTYDRSTSIRSFFTFGLPLFGSSAISYLAGNLDTILISKYHGNATLGFYNRASLMIRMPMNQIRSPLGNVILTTLTRVKDDNFRYANTIRKAQVLYLYPVVFLAVWISLCSTDIVLVLFGEKWAPSIPLVAIMAIGDAVASLSTSCSWVYLSEGKSLSLFRLNIGVAILRVGLIIAAVPFGIEVMAAVYTILSLIMWPATYLHCKKTTGFKSAALVWTSIRVCITVSLAAATAFYLGTLIALPHILHALVITAIYVLAMLLVVSLFKSTRAEMTIFLEMVSSILNRNQYSKKH